MPPAPKWGIPIGGGTAPPFRGLNGCSPGQHPWVLGGKTREVTWPGTRLSHRGRWAKVGGSGMAPWGGWGVGVPPLLVPVLRRWVLRTPTALHKALLIFLGGCASARATRGSAGAAVPPPGAAVPPLPHWHPPGAPAPQYPPPPPICAQSLPGPQLHRWHPEVSRWDTGGMGGSQGCVWGRGCRGPWGRDGVCVGPRDGVPVSSGCSQPPPAPLSPGG